MSAFLGKATEEDAPGWDESEHRALQAKIAARERFLNFALRRIRGNGSKHFYRVSGEPIFNQSGHPSGYRGIGVEILATQ